MNTTLNDTGRYSCRTEFQRRTGEYIESLASVTTYNLGVKEGPEDAAYLVGEKAELTCEVTLPGTDSDHLSVRWVKISNNLEESVPDDRTFFNPNPGNSTTGNSTLTLRNVSMSDAADYKCMASYVVDGKSFKKNSSVATIYVREFSRYLDEFSLFHIPFHYDPANGSMYDENAPHNYNDTDSWVDSHGFSCEYHGDDSVEDVFWSVVFWNGTVDAELLNNNETVFQKGSYESSNNTWSTTLFLSRKYITTNYNASLTCHFNFTTVGKPITSTTAFSVRAIRPLVSETQTSNSTENITCSYVGTDSPHSITWIVEGAIIVDDSEDYHIHDEYQIGKQRFDVLTVADRTYSDSDRNITCKYTFTSPTDEMASSTLLVYRGLHSRLQPNYYLTRDQQGLVNPLVMECQLGVGADGPAPDYTTWYFKYYEGLYLDTVDLSSNQQFQELFTISTDTVPTNGLFKSTVTLKADLPLQQYSQIPLGGSGKFGNYSCSFEFNDDSQQKITSETILHNRMVAVGDMSGDLTNATISYGYSPNFFILTCYVHPYEDSDVFNVTWSGPSDIVENSETSEERRKISEGIYLTSHYLNLTLPTKDDSGSYSCEFEFLSGPSVQGNFPELKFNDIKITNPNRVYVTASGIEVKLECRVDSPERLELGWYDVDHADWITPSNITHDGATTLATYLLEVNSTDDRGNFKCVLDENQYSKENVSVIVLDLYPSFSGVVVGNENDEVILTCTLDYNKDLNIPTIEWYKDGILYNTGITSKLNDEGDKFVSELKMTVDSSVADKDYYCVGRYSDVVASSPLTSENVTILMTQMIAERNYMIAAVGDNITLSCTAYSKQPEDIFWRIGDKNITENAERVDTSSLYVSKSVLRFTNLTADDSADIIECWFKPQEGEEKSTRITLEVLDVQTIGREVKRGEIANLTCTATPTAFATKSDLAFNWFYINISTGMEVEVPKNETYLVAEGESQLMVTRTNDTEYRCAVYSTIHQDSGYASSNVSFYVFDLTNPSDTIVHAGDKVTLSCGVSNNNGTPSFNWYKDGNSQSLHQNNGNNDYDYILSRYTFAPESFGDSGSYYCEVTMEFDGEDNGPFKSEMASLIVREIRPSFKNVTLVHNNRGERAMEKLECKYYGDKESVLSVYWETPAGRYSDGDYAESIKVEDDASSNDSYTSVLSYSRNANNSDEFSCYFELGPYGELMVKKTQASVFSYTDLYKFTYNPTQINYTYNGDVESQVTWIIDGDMYDEGKHTQFTPTTEVNKTSRKFLLAVDMTKFAAGAKPVEVKGKIGFESENVTVPYPEKNVNTTIYKRDFTTELDVKILKAHDEAEGTFTCVVAGENKDFTFSWFIGNTQLVDADDNIAFTDEANPTDSKYQRKSVLTISNLNSSPLYNDALRCVASWEQPETFSVESVADLDTVGASMEPSFYTELDGSAVLTCLVWGNEPPKEIVWTDKDQVEVEQDDNRIEMGHDTIKTGMNDVHLYTLKFVSLQQANEGQYTCYVKFDDDSDKSMVTEVNFIGASFEPESPYFIHDLLETIQFTCNYKGFREPKGVTWFKDSKEDGNKLSNTSVLYDIETGTFKNDFNTQKSVLTIKTNNIDASGDYICEWETKEGLTVSATMMLAVRTLQPKTELYFSTDKMISLECEYKGQEEGEMKWFNESRLITEENERTSFANGNFENNAQTFQLQISKVTREDAGRYTCVLSFEDGDEITATTKAVVRESRVMSEHMSLSDEGTLVYVEDDVLEMQCALEGDKIPDNVQWFYEDNEIYFDGRMKTVVNAVLSQESWGVRFFSNATFKGQDSISDGNYTCKFSFLDEESAGTEKTSSTKTYARVLAIEVDADKTCTFVDFEKEADASLGCSLEGDIESVGVEIKAAVMSLPDDGSTRLLEVSKNPDYTVVNVTSENDGIYKCGFIMDSEGHPEFSATQRLTARRALLDLISSSRMVVSGTTLTLECYIEGGAKSISWYEDDVEIRNFEERYTDHLENGHIEQMSISFQVPSTDSNTTKSYKCRGMIYDEFCPRQKEFDSAVSPIEVIPAKPLQNPSNGFAYEGESHVFTCRFPDAGDGGLYNVYWMFNDQRILNNGDYYDNGKRVINGEIETFANRSGNELDQIDTRYRIHSIDSKAKGKYKCGISWRNGVSIKSDSAILEIREISQPPHVVNVVFNADAKLNCSAAADKAANITFYKLGEGSDNSTLVDGTTQTDNADQNPDIVVTEGEVILSSVDDTSPGYYYCNVTWGNKSLTSDPVYLNVFETYEDGNDTWGAQGNVVRLECQSDAALRTDGNKTSYLDEKNKVVFAEASVNWKYKGPSEANFKDIDENIQHTTENSWIGFDGYRRSEIIIGPIKREYNDLEFACSVEYQDDEKHNFYGGTTMSKPTKLRISSIQSFTSSQNEIIVGETFELTCTVIGKEVPDFRITNDGRFLDASRYNIISKSVESPNELLHLAKFKITTKVATVIQGGQDFYCSVDFGTSTPELREKITITTNYDCRKAKISVLGRQPDGQTITYKDEEGDRKATVQCPADTADTKYSVYESAQAKKESECRKETGFYDPPYLGTCLETHAFESGRFEQVWSLSSAGGTYCTDSVQGQFSKKEMTEALTTDNSLCGPYPIVPCLQNSKCTLDVSNTGCRWDDSTKKLYVFYQVDFNDPVWKIQERKDLTNPQSGTKIKFWDCPDTLLNPKKRTISKRGKLFERMVADQDSDMVIVLNLDGRSYSTLGIGIAGFIVAAVLVGAFLYRRRYTKENPNMVVGTEQFEMTNRSVVVTNPYSL
ncbi:uncharacterized protein LOC134820273 isoform X2 [Bolinopsis microptera]|uniref:uncharacterized protein LOC134820273 isoform X2 n=1 Tax=Bolinopsis microptera TaxID=2820187 RepID=UPI003079E4D6